MRKELETTYLGNYIEPTASEIVSALEDAGIECWCKYPSGTYTPGYGARIFVDKDRLYEGRQIADRIVTEAVQRQALEDTDLEDRAEDTEQDDGEEV